MSERREAWRRRIGPLYGLAVQVHAHTLLPAPSALDASPNDLARSVVWLPVVGSMVGVVLAFAAVMLTVGPLPRTIQLLGLLALSVLLTDARRERGLMSTVERIAGPAPSVTSRQVFPRVGLAGGLSAVALLSVRFLTLRAMHPAIVPGALVVAFTFAYWSILRVPQWVGSGAKEQASAAGGRILAAVYTVVIAHALIGETASLAFVLVMSTMAMAASRARRRERLTADTLGAVSVLCEALVLWVCALRFPPDLPI